MKNVKINIIIVGEIMKKLYEKDLYRYYGRKEKINEYFKRDIEKKYIVLFRKAQESKGIFKKINKYRLFKMSQKSMIQIPIDTKIGEGLYIDHLGSIVINPKTVIGKNVNIVQGVTIGQTNRGEKEGCPIIGDNVWIGANAVIVGKIKIGNDVLIAPNSYVNIDVPSHSVVIGNPAQIHHKENATDGYINRTI